MNRGLINELRNSLADVIARDKAYNVPALCSRLGLDAGEESDAMRSKFRYASTRLASLTADRLIGIAKLLLEEEHDFGLAELVAKMLEMGTPAVTELTRRRLIAGFDSEPLCTGYDEIEFLETIWPIAAMPGIQTNASFDDIGFRSLRDEIFQHMRRNDDWTNRELLERLGLMTASRKLLFRFLEASVNPIAIDDSLQKVRVERINSHLQHDGYRLARTGTISGSSVFTVAAHVIGSPADSTISSALQRFDPDLIHGRWAAALDRRANDPAGAITLARTLLEDVCRWLLEELEEEASDQDDLPTLYRKLAKGLKLAPDDHSEQVFKQILGSCQSVVESLGAIRNKLGDAHGSGRKRAKPAARHAELAVNLAGSMATFLVATWEARSGSSKEPSDLAG